MNKQKSLTLIFTIIGLLGFASLVLPHQGVFGQTSPSIFLPLVLNDAPLPPHVTINEVLYWEDATTTEWIELYNGTSDPVALDGWQVTNVTRSQIVALPAWSLPAGAYLVVYFAPGTNDADFSDGAGAYYTGAATPFFDNTEDGAALYSGSPDSSTLVDFVAWSQNDSHGGGAAMDDAVAASQWSADDFYPTLLPATPYLLTRPVMAGESIGRDQHATDTNSSLDWDSLGGEDSAISTPGQANYTDMTPTNIGASPPALQPMAVVTRTWTIMVFMDGRDKRIRNEQWADVNAMEQAGSDANVNLVVQFADPRGRYYRCYLQTDTSNAINSPCTRLTGTINPGSPDSLSAFIQWVKTHYPAQKYALILDGHGAGWKGLFPSGNDPLTMSELSTALLNGGLNFRNIMFVACLMGQIEVADQIQNYTETVVASEEVTYAVFPYTTFLTELKNTPSMESVQYAKRAAQLYGNRLAAISSQYTIAAYLESAEPIILLDINDLASKLRTDVEDYRQHDLVADNAQVVIKHQALEQSETFYDRNYIDLRHFAQLIANLPLSAASAGTTLANDLAVGDTKFILYEAHGNGHPNANGVSIYFPHDLNGWDHISGRTCRGCTGWEDFVYDDPWPSPHLYRRDPNILIPRLRNENHALADDSSFLFPKSTTWAFFLHRYYKPVADACIRKAGGECTSSIIIPVGETVTLSGMGSSDSDGPEDDNARKINNEFAIGSRIGQGNDVPAHSDNTVVHWYWDFNAQQDTGGDIPAYQEGVLYLTCDSDDCDRDEVDSTNDDPDATGRTVNYTCQTEGKHTITLWVWDEHHDQIRRHHENLLHNEGRHWLHFNVDSDTVTVTCFQPQVPVKVADRTTIGPNETVHYLINLPASTTITNTVFGTITDQLPLQLTPENIQCSFGTCGYDSTQHLVYWYFENRVPTLRVWMEYDAIFVPDSPACPPELLNQATGWDGWENVDLKYSLIPQCP